MDESALRTLIATLEASRSSAHWRFEVCTAMVVAGVVLEVVFVIWEFVIEWRDFKRGEVHPPERPLIMLFVLGLLGAGLVAIGVAGELRYESKIETIETGIREANEDLFLLLSKEAGDAKDSAIKAADAGKIAKDQSDAAVLSASNALSLAKGAREEADSFKQDIASAKQLAADAESHLADALQRAANAEAD